MKTADEILHEHGIAPPPPGKHRYYTTCPQCSANRSRAHQKAACLGVTVKGDGVTWGCNHCLWTGGGYYNGKINGPGGEPARTYDYLDEQGKLLFQKVRNPPGERNGSGNAGRTARAAGSTTHRASARSSIGCPSCLRRSPASAPFSWSRARKTLTACGASASRRPAARTAQATSGRPQNGA